MNNVELYATKWCVHKTLDCKEIFLQCLIVLLGKTPTVESEWILLWFSVAQNVNA